ncbi:hypothetical protein EST38_g8784 [Candolleomyces aberdarensis]|uniref:Mucoidy inhibitor A n=1 Tax=Candolleomyces aberdarensis TaxID=2316362 RepID=A0A4Q2DEW1_9AGAR|nr:hypothetical protein EST38_g8784 [Candolleomyces aberdarensis]
MATSTSAKSVATLPQQNVIELTSSVDSKIAGVSVYSHRAEVTRTFNLALTPGQNQVEISGLPRLLIQDSLRVEGKELDTRLLEESEEIKPLRLRKFELEQAIERNDQSKDTLKKYMDSLASPRTASFSEVVETTSEYDIAVTELQKKGNALAEDLEVVTKALSTKQRALKDAAKTKWDEKLSLKVSVRILAEVEGEIELSLIYAVSNTSWSPRYAIRVDTHSKDKAVSLVYKADITQMSGEDWTDVSMTLETATPSFDKTLPTLGPWTIRAYKPAPYPVILSGSMPAPLPAYHAVLQRPISPSWRRSRSRSSSPGEVMYHTPATVRPTILPQLAMVSSLGDVSATFGVPGITTIPSDGARHTVTIASLELDAKLCWVSVPKKDAKTYLSAKIQNVSEYALLEGPANVYVDGSFIARSTIPAVNPEEKFECALGIYPAIRITYHPLAKKLSQSGLLSKSKVYNYTRRITIHNTKNSTVEGIKIIDQIPVSEDATITVKLISPALQLPNFSSPANAAPVSPGDTGSVPSSGKGGLFRNIGGSGNNSNSPSDTPSDKALKAVAKSVKVSPGVIAQWNRPDDLHSITGDGSTEETKVHRSSESVSDSSEPLDLTALGKDGKISWICSIPPQTKINLTLQWEVSAPVNTDIVGI